MQRSGEATALVRNQFAALDGTVTLWPWELVGEPTALYEAAARRA